MSKQLRVQKTYFPTKEKALADRKWIIVDAQDVPLGRLATKVAAHLRGKHRIDYSPHVDTGDFVVVTNAAKVALTGAKAQTKVYNWHTGFPGGIKSIKAGDFRDSDPVGLVTIAVKKMLPHGPLGFSQINKLKVYAGTDHPHLAQQPSKVGVPYGPKAGRAKKAEGVGQAA